MAFISKYCKGEKCSLCWKDERKLVEATHKIGEIIFDDDPHRNRHELTQYICDKHFNRIMGPIK